MPTSTRQEDLRLVRERLLAAAWNDFQSFSTDKAAIVASLDEYMERIIVPKSDDQLHLIQNFPDLQCSPALLRASGLVEKVATNESSVIYIKFHIGKRSSLETLSNAVRPATRAFATRMSKFLQEPVPDHLSPLSEHTDRSGDTLFFSHVGRFCAGKINRSFWEHNEGRHYRPLKGGRIWADCMYACGSDGSGMEYHVLANHSQKTGGAWATAMVSLITLSRCT
jgi:hypothetical protein